MLITLPTPNVEEISVGLREVLKKPRVGLKGRKPEVTFGAVGALMNRVLQPRPLVVLGLNVWTGRELIDYKTSMTPH